METVRARPLFGADTADLKVGDPLIIRNSRLPSTFTRGAVKSLTRRDVYRHGEHGPKRTYGRPKYGRADVWVLEPAVGEPIGQEIQVGWRSEYGVESTLTLYTTPEAFDRNFPGSDETKRRGPEYDAERARYLNRLVEGDVRVEQTFDHPPWEEDYEEVPLTPVWGAQVSAAVYVEGADPEQVKAVMEAAVAEAFPGEHAYASRVKARALQDVWVMVRGLGDADEPWQGPYLYDLAPLANGEVMTVNKEAAFPDVW
jgi:hypothetical protein